MEFKDILAISGFGGLFKYIAQAHNGIIVEGFEDKKRMNAFTHYKVSSLNDVAIYAESGEIPLRKVFKTIQEVEKGGPAIDAKSDDAKLKEYFTRIVPDYDRQKVYMSDIRKLISWYNILQKNGYTNFEEEKKEEETKDKKETTEELKDTKEHPIPEKKETHTKMKPVEKKKTKEATKRQVVQTVKTRKKT